MPDRKGYPMDETYAFLLAEATESFVTFEKYDYLLDGDSEIAPDLALSPSLVVGVDGFYFAGAAGANSAYDAVIRGGLLEHWRGAVMQDEIRMLLP